jgi:hypothetical protein
VSNFLGSKVVRAQIVCSLGDFEFACWSIPMTEL